MRHSPKYLLLLLSMVLILATFGFQESARVLSPSTIQMDIPINPGI